MPDGAAERGEIPRVVHGSFAVDAQVFEVLRAFFERIRALVVCIRAATVSVIASTTSSKILSVTGALPLLATSAFSRSSRLVSHTALRL